MKQEPREIAAADSYPTFWDNVPPQVPAPQPVPAQDAYSVFVNLTEDDFPADTAADDE